MKKLLTAAFIVWSLFFMPAANAESETYIGEGKATMSEAETQEQIIERAKTYALQNAREKAGVYIRRRSELRDFELVEDDIVTMTAGVLKITDTQIEKTLVNDVIQIFVTVTVIIDSDELKQNIDDFIRSHDNIPAKNIPADAVKFNYNGHSYKLFNMGLNWNDAKAYCESLGGHLATITTSQEQAIIETLLRTKGTKNSYWLGGHKNGDEWVWITEEPFSYCWWATWQPDGDGNALMVYRQNNPVVPNATPLGSWNDIRFDGTCKGEPFFGANNFGFICEWDN